jgi:hypothetical protein
MKLCQHDLQPKVHRGSLVKSTIVNYLTKTVTHHQAQMLYSRDVTAQMRAAGNSGHEKRFELDLTEFNWLGIVSSGIFWLR